MEKIFVSLSYYIYNAFGIYIIYLYNKIFFDRSEVKRWIENLSYVMYFIVIYIIYQAWNNPLLTIGSNIIICFLITCLYKDSRLKGMLLSILINAIFFLIEGIAYTIIVKFNINSLEYVIFFTSTFATFICVVILNKIITRKQEKQLEVLQWCQICLIPCISIGLAYILVIFVCKTTYTGIALVGLLIVNFILFYLYEKLTEFYTNKYENDILHENNRAYLNEINIIKDSNDNLRYMKHDLNNHILTMKDMIKNGNYDCCSAYLESMQEHLIVENKFVDTGNPTIDGILNYKLQKAIENQIRLKVDVRIPDNLRIKEFDFTVILGNILDNAIESAQKCNEKYIEIIIQFEKGVLRIHTINSCLKKEIVKCEQHKHFQKLVGHTNKRITTKRDKDNHGYGILQIKKIVQRYNGKFSITFKEESCHCIAVLFLTN